MNRRLILKYSAVLFWLIVIFMFSNQPATSSSAMSSPFVDVLKPYLPNFSVAFLTFAVRKSAHIVAYSVLGALVYNVAVEYRLRYRYKIGYSLLFVGMYACLDEVHQLFRAGRSGEPRDVLIDVLAGLVGILLYRHIVDKAPSQS